jgi:hypothetical protein
VSIISCSECGKKISSRAVICSYCGAQLGEVTEEDLRLNQARRLRDRIYRLNMTSYAVITAFIAACCWYWWESRGFSQIMARGPFVLMGIAAIAYLVVRAFLFRNRQQLKAMRQARRMSSDLRRNL